MNQNEQNEQNKSQNERNKAQNEQNIEFSGGNQRGIGISQTGNVDVHYVEQNAGNQIDLQALLTDLTRLREELDKRKSSTQDYIALGKVAEAEAATADAITQKDNGSKVWEILKTSGKWVLDTATDIGAKVAVEAIKKSMGL